LSECAVISVASMSDDQRPGGSHAEREHPFTHTGPGAPQRVDELVLADRVDETPGGRVGGDRAEQSGLVAQRAQVAQRVAPVGEHHRQIAHDPTRVVARAALAQAGERARERTGEAEPVGALGEQRRAGVADRLIVSVRSHRHSDRAAIALHLQGDPPELGSRPSTSRNLPAQPDRTSAPAPVGALATARTGLVRDVLY
jgi:hypothetical protein